jgi:hypothetical protein
MAGVLNELQQYLNDGIFEPELEQIARHISAELDGPDTPGVVTRSP